MRTEEKPIHDGIKYTFIVWIRQWVLPMNKCAFDLPTPPLHIVMFDQNSDRAVDDDCAICLLPIDGQFSLDPRGNIPCGHGPRFHKTCLDKWLGEHQACPFCRAPTDAGKLNFDTML